MVGGLSNIGLISFPFFHFCLLYIVLNLFFFANSDGPNRCLMSYWLTYWLIDFKILWTLSLIAIFLLSNWLLAKNWFFHPRITINLLRSCFLQLLFLRSWCLLQPAFIPSLLNHHRNMQIDSNGILKPFLIPKSVYSQQKLTKLVW